MNDVPISKTQWKTLFAAHLGWLLDGFDVMLYAFAIPAIKSEFGLTLSQAGILASATLAASSVGGIAAGVLADRFGRARVLIYSILIYSVFTGLTGTASSLAALFAWRAFVGLGLGGEWSAGSVLVSETWPARHRGKAVGLMQAGWAVGYILAALAAGIFLPGGHWRLLFFLGIFPALATFWIRRHIPEPEVWRHKKQSVSFVSRFQKDRVFRSRVFLGTLLSTACLFAYWGLFTWIPSYLSLPRSSGGAGLTVVNSVKWIIPMEIGAFFGYVTFGIVADRFGRRSTFFVFVLLSAVFTILYGKLTNFPEFLLLLGPLVGFFGHGYFSLFGALLSELFDTGIRATAQGLCYNFGRAVSAAAPFVVGRLSERYGVGAAISFTSLVYIVAAALIFLLPETRGDTLT